MTTNNLPKVVACIKLGDVTFKVMQVQENQFENAAFDYEGAEFYRAQNLVSLTDAMTDLAQFTASEYAGSDEDDRLSITLGDDFEI
jgi:hypothetical protein